jgi:hypothetical protein
MTEHRTIHAIAADLEVYRSLLAKLLALYAPAALIAACGASAKPPTPPANPAPRGYGYEFAVDTAEQATASTPAHTHTLPTGPGGQLFPESIQTVVRAHFDSVLRCYDEGRQRNPNLKGKVIVKFIIGEDGNTKEAVDAGSSLPEKDVVGCVVGKFRERKYRESHMGDVTVIYPIQFGR